MILTSALVFSIISGLMLGTLYALTAFSLTFIYGILRFVNSAQGQFMMIGAYTAYWLFVLYALPPYLSALASFVIGLALGYIIFIAIVSRLLNVPPIYTLIVAFSISILLEEVAKLLWEPTYRAFIYDIGTVSLFEYKIPLLRILGSIISLAIMIILYTFIYKTEYGRIIRSVVQSPEGASICGINIKKVYMNAFALCIGLALFCGTISTLYVSSGINPYMGAPYTDTAFAISVLGGMGSPEGALIGGLIYGVLETLSFAIFSAIPGLSPYPMSRFISFVLLLIVLLIRPRGLMGR